MYSNIDQDKHDSPRVGRTFGFIVYPRQSLGLVVPSLSAQSRTPSGKRERERERGERSKVLIDCEIDCQLVPINY